MRNKTAIIASVAAGLLFVFLWQQLQATRLGYEMGRARAEVRAQRERNAYLRMELARLSAPERVAREAQARLGMAPPVPEAIVFLGSTVARPEEPRLLTLLVE